MNDSSFVTVYYSKAAKISKAGKAEEHEALILFSWSIPQVREERGVD